MQFANRQVARLLGPKAEKQAITLPPKPTSVRVWVPGFFPAPLGHNIGFRLGLGYGV